MNGKGLAAFRRSSSSRGAIALTPAESPATLAPDWP
jgi:hypothetical protein